MLELERLVEDEGDEDAVKECDDFNGEIPQTVDFLYETLKDRVSISSSSAKDYYLFFFFLR